MKQNRSNNVEKEGLSQQGYYILHELVVAFDQLIALMGKQPSNSLLILQTNQDLVRLDYIPLDQLAELTQRYQVLEENDWLGEVWLGL